MVGVIPTKSRLLMIGISTLAIVLNCNAYSIISKGATLAKTTAKAKAQRSISRALFASSSDSTDTNVNGDKNVPFFASTLDKAGSFFSSTPASTSKEGKAASITTRLPLGTLFDSREYTFETVTNVRSVHFQKPDI